ncbi:MAG: ABC transporter ATP-binding protein [Gammaproteobacteria bacterium]|nr:ABC transporter ATP-binding protein [Gammaproteobacteria bacterium]
MQRPPAKLDERGRLVAEVMTAERISSRETFRLLGRSLRFVWPHRRQIGVKLALTLIGLSIVLFLPWPLKILIDHVVMGLPVGSSPTPYPPYISWFVDMLHGLSPFEIVWVIIAISLLGIVLVGAFGGGVARDYASGGLSEGLDTATQSENQANASGSRVSGLLGLFEFRYQLRITHRINHGLRTLLFGRLMAWPLTRYSDASVGDAVYRTMYDTPAISRVCYDILVLPIANLFVIGTVIWTTAHSFSAVPTLIVVACLAAPMVLLSTLLMTGITRRRSLASRSAGAETTATVEEGMSNVVAVQGLGASRRQRAAFAADSRESFKRFRSYIVMVLLLLVVQAAVTVGLVFYVFFDICEAIIVGRMSPGDFTVVYAYFVQLVTNVSGLGSMWFNLQNNVAGMRRVYDVVDSPVDADLQGNDAIERLRSIEVDQVSYRYPDGTQAVREASLEGRVGEVVALVGATGAGKSTLAYLLAGFVHPHAGAVRFDGVDARTVSVDCLRAQVAFVFQEAFLFDDTVENNIRMSVPNATRGEVVEAARVAGALGFIQALPQGFATRLGRAGGTLSVGQKQRLAIARGLVSKAPVLVLDEPTASLDPETENALVAALDAGRRDRVLVVIAHRLSTIRRADRICFMDEGRIVESGNHEELMSLPNGAYRSFVELQVGVAT